MRELVTSLWKEMASDDSTASLLTIPKQYLKLNVAVLFKDVHQCILRQHDNFTCSIFPAGTVSTFLTVTTGGTVRVFDTGPTTES